MIYTDVDGLAMRTANACLAFGLNPRTVWDEYSRYLPLLKLHEIRGATNFSNELADEYLRQTEGRFDRSEISLKHYLGVKQAVRRLIEVSETGTLNWAAPRKRSGFQSNDYYETRLKEFIDDGRFSKKGTSDATWVARKYFGWLIENGYGDLTNVGVDEIQRFVIYCSHHMKGSGLHNVKLYLKKLYAHLAAGGFAQSDYAGLFAFHVSRGSRVLPALPSYEIAAILDTIDKRTPKGKRDYAMILLGIVLGMRACDIAQLKLSDVDWKTGEIKIVQAKTGKSLAMPLTKDVGDAIRDYVLNGRQKTSSDAMFLRNRAPYQGFSNGVAIGDLFDDYRARAGLSRKAYDGKGFHALRRTFAKSLVTSGIDVYDVEQMLGGDNIESAKKYISLDSEHLKECALDFEGITIEGGAYRG